MIVSVIAPAVALVALAFVLGMWLGHDTQDPSVAAIAASSIFLLDSPSALGGML